MEDDEGAAPVHVGEKMAPALIAVHPQGSVLVVAIGAGLRIFDIKNETPVTVEDHTTPSRHGEAIRAVTFSDDGNRFASAGDDKLVKLWDTKSWRCIKTTRLQKKVTGVSFSQDCKWLLFADKFGVVFVLSSSLTTKDEPVQLLAHCCSIITDLKLSPDGQYIVTSDRDFKIRVSVFPSLPTKGAHDIWSYCLGHSSFVTCIAFVGDRNSPQQLLISGSGDSTVRLWDYQCGTLLDSFNTHDMAEFTRDKRGEGTPPAVVGVSVSPNGCVIAVIIERFAGVLLLEYDNHVKKLTYLQNVILPEQVSPTSVAFDVHGRLWSVAGAAETAESSDRNVTPEEAAAAESEAQAIAQTAVAHVRLITSSSYTPSASTTEENPKTPGEYVLCEDDSMPGGEALLTTLQGNKVDSTEVAEAAEAAEVAMRQLMTKRQYTNDQRENRKRFRNDKKLENKMG